MAGTRWRGLLAPINKPTGDGRRIAPGGFTNRPLPLPLKWQRADSNGHDESVTVGVIDVLNIDEEAGEVWGEGELFDDVNPATTPQLAEDAATARTLMEKRVVGPSVDPGSAQATAVMTGMDRAPTMAEIQRFCDQNDGNMPPTEMLFTDYEIAGATLVPIPAFSEARPLELMAAGAGLTASKVRSGGWDSLPIAARDRAWDGDAAKARLATDCGLDGDSPDWDCYASGFLYQYTDRDPQTRGAYSFPVVDVIDGQRQIVPAAVYAAANILSGGRGGTDIPAEKQKAMRTVVASLYKRLAKEFDDDSVRAPWAGKMSAILAAAGLPPLDGSLFLDPELDRITPLTREPMGNGWTRVFGHIATHDVCLVGQPGGVCTTAPFSDQDYQTFHRYHRTAGGVELPLAVGRLTAAHGQLSATCRCCPGNDDHACNNVGFGAAVAHHDRMRVLAYGRAGEDERNNAIWFAGVEAPEVDERDVKLLNRRKVSGDWRETAGNMELVEILVLSRREPGFPLPRVSVENGRQRSLTAASPIGAIIEREGGQAEVIDTGQLGEAIGLAVAGVLGEFGLNPRQRREPEPPDAGQGGGDSPVADRGRGAYNAAVMNGALAAQAENEGDPDDELESQMGFIQGLMGEQDVDSSLEINMAVDHLREMLLRSYLDVEDLPEFDTDGLPAVTAAAAVHTGAMVALRMSEADAARLAVTDGEPLDQLHLTLAYLGDADQIPPEVREKIAARMGRVAGSYKEPLVGDGFAVDVFNPGTANNRDTAIVMGVGGQSVADVHEAVMGGLGDIEELSMPEQHAPWVPHTTLQYTDDLNRVKALADRVGPVTFDRLRLAFGGEVTDIPIGAATAEGGDEDDQQGAAFASGIEGGKMCAKMGCGKNSTECATCTDCTPAVLGTRAQAATLALRATLAASQLGCCKTPAR
jgi:2'-5' RNA ligase